MSLRNVPFSVVTPSGTRLDGLADYPDAPGPRPAVVVVHGFKGFMEWGFFPYLAELVAERGYVALRFNLSGTGQRPGEDRVSDLDAFRRNTYRRERDELLALLGAVAGDPPGGDTGAGTAEGLRREAVAAGPLGLVGHSRGGATALLAAAHPAWRDRVAALVTWAAIAETDRFTDEQKRAWRRDGELEVVNARTGQRLTLGVELLDEVERHPGELDLAAAAGRRRAPWLIVHGEDDESVPAAEADRLHAAAAKPKALERVPAAGHTFGARHPFAGPTPELIRALNTTQSWLRRHLPRD